MRRIGYILGLLAAFASLAFTQVLPDAAQLEAWQHFNRQHEENAVIRWHKETGTPATIYNFKSVAYTSIGKPEEIARQFLKDNRDIFKMKANLSDLVLLRQLEDNDMYHIDFRQTHKGIPVYGAEYSVAVDLDKTVHMTGGKYYPDMKAPTNAFVSEEEAINQALAFFNMEKQDLRELASELVVVPGDTPFLAYRLGLNQWEAVVNASTGKVEIYFERIARINGVGKVYPKDPVNSTLTTVTIPRLLGSGYYLEGTYVDATNAELGDAYSTSRSFQYTPPYYTQHDGTHFDDTNVYYHIDKFAYEYWPDVGYPGLGVQVLASVHDPYPYGHDNAAANLGTMRLYFGHGVSIFWDLAKKNDVIYHEYTHLVSGTIGLLYYQESAAMHEGYSDYHAGSFTNDPQIGEWVTRNYPDLRTMATNPSVYNYNDYNNLPFYSVQQSQSAHLNGMIWSGALWDLRGALGSSITNFLVYKGLVYKHASGTTFLDGREGVIIADQNYYSGAHVSTINNVFAARGIDPPPAAPTGLTITNAGQFGQYVQLAWNANSEPDLNHYNVWRECTYPGDPDCDLQVISSRTWTSYTDTRVTIQGHYPEMEIFYYYVTAVDDASQESEKSAPASTWGEWSYLKGMDQVAEESLPEAYALGANHPNPFNPATTIRYDLPEASSVSLVIYDIAGREIRSWNLQEQAGYRQLIWDGKNQSGQLVPTGIYIYRLVAASVESDQRFTASRKMVLIR